MKMQVRVLLSVLVALALMFLAACGGSYNCAVTFGSSSCTPTGSGFGGGGTGGTGGGGGGGTAPVAFAYAVDQNGFMDGYDLSAGAATFAADQRLPVAGDSTHGSEHWSGRGTAAVSLHRVFLDEPDLWMVD